MHQGEYSWKMMKVSDVKASAEEVSSLGYNTSDWLSAIVPGTVLNSLVYNKKYPEPYYGLNNKIESNKIPDISKVGREFYYLFNPAGTKPLVTAFSTPYTPTNGLKSRYIALWRRSSPSCIDQTDTLGMATRHFQDSGGFIYAKLCTPSWFPVFLNAVTNVLMPRERDSQIAEVVVDNDGCLHSRSVYTEKIGDKNWMQGTGEGFAHLRDQYINFENPFREGTFRTVETVKGKKEKERVLQMDS